MTSTFATRCSDRITASIYGLILGDMIGSRYEFSRRQTEYESVEFRKHNTISSILENPNVFGHHGYTDDSIFALLAIESFNKLEVFDSYHQWKTARRYLEDPLTAYSPNGRMFDIGNSTLKSLAEYGSHPSKQNECNSGNGVIMKLAPYAAWAINVPNRCDRNIFFDDVTNLTHGSVDTIVTTRGFGNALLDVFLETNNTEVIDSYILPEDEYNAHSYQGYCVDSLHFLANNRYRKLSDIAFEAIRLGGDVDTNLAIAYQYLGAERPHIMICFWELYKQTLKNHEVIDKLVSDFAKLVTKDLQQEI